MVNLDIIKENIGFEKSLGENLTDNVIKEEYLIPDTHPDVQRVLSVDVNSMITSKEVQSERVLVEVQVDYNVIYLAKEEIGLGVNNVNYKEKFSSFIDVVGAEHRMVCDAECDLEHINVNIINERKISIESYFRTKCNVFRGEEFEFVKDIEGTENLQIKKKPDNIEKIIATKNSKMNLSNQMKIDMDKPQIGKIIKCNYMIHKKEVKILEDKVQTSCFINMKLVYRTNESNELIIIEDDVFVSNEEEALGVNSDMFSTYDFKMMSSDIKIVKDDLGENRILDINGVINAEVKVFKVENIEIIEDAYSPSKNITLDKEKCIMNMTLGQGSNETIVKDNIYLDENDLEPVQIINSIGKITGLETKIIDDKIMVEGILKVDTIYKCNDEEIGLAKISGEIPFSTNIEMKNIKDNMNCLVKGYIENLQTGIEANTIAIKAMIIVNAKVNYDEEKEYIKDLEEKENENIEKIASIIIYVVQPGDTLWSLAKKYHTTIEDIANLNNIENPDMIHPGDKIIIPGRAII